MSVYVSVDMLTSIYFPQGPGLWGTDGEAASLPANQVRLEQELFAPNSCSDVSTFSSAPALVQTAWPWWIKHNDGSSSSGVSSAILAGAWGMGHVSSSM